MQPSAKQLLEQIDKATVEAEEAASKVGKLKSQLFLIQNCCRHQWGKTEMKQHTTPGYQTEGDAPGTMGVDWRGPQYVPPDTKTWWVRTCTECGLEQKTERSKPSGEVVPVFSNH